MTKENTESETNRSRHWLYGSNLVILVIIAVVIVTLLMVMTANLTIKKDLTSSGLYSLSGYTHQLLKQVDEKHPSGKKEPDYKLISLFSFVQNPQTQAEIRQNENAQQVNDLLDEYARASSNITFKHAAELGADTLKQEIRDRYTDEVKPYKEAVDGYKKINDDLEKFSKQEAANLGALAQGDGAKEQLLEQAGNLQIFFASKVPSLLSRNKKLIKDSTETTAPDYEKVIATFKTAAQVPGRMELVDLEKTLGLLANPDQVKEVLPAVARYFADAPTNTHYKAIHDELKAYVDGMDKLQPLKVDAVFESLAPNTIIVIGPSSAAVIPESDRKSVV